MKSVATAALTTLTMAVFAQTDTPQTSTLPATSTDSTQAEAAQPDNLLPMPEPLTIEKIFPVIGSYQASAEQANGPASITITIDPENKGYAWIDGLAQGKVKALLMRSPATYKIPAQTTETGTAVKEGTLIYDKETQTLSLCLGCEYNYADPTTAFQMDTEAKDQKVKKEKHWVFVGTKVENSTAAY